MAFPFENSRFQFIEKLGCGGTAEVVRVFDTKLGREAALKYPLAETDNSETPFSALARREYELISDLRFPGLIQPLAKPDENAEFILLQLCTGPTLDSIGRPPINQALNILSAIATVLEFLRAVELVHGDLKPENVFLPPDWKCLDSRPAKHVKLSDFSLGKRFAESDNIRLGLGTVGFMAPETIADGRANHQSDLFALGIIAYQLLSGHHPFMDGACEPVTVSSRTREDPEIPLADFCPGIDPDLASLVHSLLAKAEKERPQTAIEVCETLVRLGSKYPYKRILRPSAFMRVNDNYDESASRWLELDADGRARIDSITDRTVAGLRMALTANFIRNNLVYSDGRFRWRNAPYWPAVCRRRLLNRFALLPFSLRRQAVVCAVVGNHALVEDLAGRKTTKTPDPSFTALLIHLLRPATVKRLSKRYAGLAEEKQLAGPAARLYVQAGNLEAAERCAQEAAIRFNGEHRNKEALSLINEVTRYARLSGKEFRVRRLVKLAADYHKEDGDIADALDVCRRLVELYRDRTPDSLLADAYNRLGDLHRLRQDFGKALDALDRSREISQQLGDELQVSRVLNNMGNTYWLTAEMSKALTCYRKALRIQRQMKADADAATTLNNIGNVYGVLGRHSRCISLLTITLRLKKELGHAGEIARTLNNLGYASYIVGDIDKAVDCLTESLQINRRIGSKKEMLFNLENLTAIMISGGQLDRSLIHIREGLQLSESLDDRSHVAVFHNKMATVYRRLGRLRETTECIERADSICREIDSRHLEIEIRLQKAMYQYAVGDRRQALQLGLAALREAKEINDAESQLSALLLVTRLSDKTEHQRDAEKLIGSMHLKRERRLLEFNRLELCLYYEQWDRARIMAENLSRTFSQSSKDLETAWMCNLVAEAQLDSSPPESTRKHIKRAISAAENSGTIHELAEALALSGRLLYLQKDWESCYADFKKSLRLHKKIVDTIPDEADRRIYQQRRTVMLLAKKIKQLGELLANRRGQV
ncbi:MAG: tetratricopeptide repeat protein [Candidatus Zixiibacteriota bacterium]|nr:MAG: tetratricopeptide repeat protein [candidate division Zixibacteria bacterium]